MRTHARDLSAGTAVLAGLVLLASAGATAQPFPDLIPLPADFGPEGIAVGNGTTFYAGLARGIHAWSDSGRRPADRRRRHAGGARRRASDRDEARREEQPAVRRPWCAAAWAPSSMRRRGTSWRSTSFQTAPTFINDVVVTREAAYFTDTQAPFLYRVELGPAGEPAADATRIPLPDTFRTNGIAATPQRRSISSSSMARRRSCTGSTRPRTRRSSSISAETRCPTRTDCCSTARRCTSCRTSATGSPSSSWRPTICPARSCASSRNHSRRMHPRRCRPPLRSSAMRCTP